MVNTPIPPEAVQIQATFLEGEDTLVLLANVFAIQQQQEDDDRYDQLRLHQYKKIVQHVKSLELRV